MDALGCRVAFVAPAYPENGRILRDGVLYAGDEKINAMDIISSDMKRSVRSVPLSVVQQGPDTLVQYIGNSRDSGTEVFVFDACTDEDLENVYLAADRCGEKYVLCGSAGLARFDARKLAGKLGDTQHTDMAGEPRENGIIIAVTGSRNRETRSQFLKVSETLKVPCIVIDKELVAGHKAELAIRKCLKEAEERICQGDRVLLIGVSSLFEEFHMVLKDSEENYRMAFDLAVCLGKLTARMYKKNPVRGIISNGGDTTLQLCRQLGVYGIEPVSEVVPGAPLGIMVGGRADGTAIITKSGGFGGDSVLVDCISFLEH
jgi:D-threonate/D-erythronate kinase